MVIEKNKGSSLRIMSLNIWHGNFHEPLLEFIEQESWQNDILCFQEIDEKICRDIKLALKDRFNLFYAEKPGAHPVSNATYVSKRLPVIESRTILGADQDTGLGLVCITECEPGQLVAITNVHGCSRPGDKRDTPARLRQSEAIISSMTKNGDAFNIIVGDFNLMPDTESISMIEESGFSNLIAEYAIRTTRNEAAWNRYPDDKQLYADYTFVQKSPRVNHDFRVIDNLVSDHLPMLTTISLK